MFIYTYVVVPNASYKGLPHVCIFPTLCRLVICLRCLFREDPIRTCTFECIRITFEKRHGYFCNNSVNTRDFRL